MQGQEGRGATSFNLHYHFTYRHPADKVSMGGVCLPKCPSYGLQVGTAGALEHLASKTCRELTAQQQQREVAAASAAALQHTFTAYEDRLRRVEQFKYLGRVMYIDDNDVPAMQRNLKWTRRLGAGCARSWRRRRFLLKSRECFIREWLRPTFCTGQDVGAASLWDPCSRGLPCQGGRLTGMRPKKVDKVWEYPHSVDVWRSRVYGPSRTPSSSAGATLPRQ